MIFDADNDRIGFTPHITSTATVETNATLPTSIIVIDTNPSLPYVSPDNFNIDFYSIGQVGLKFSVFMGCFLLSMTSVFFGFNFLSPVFNIFGITILK